MAPITSDSEDDEIWGFLAGSAEGQDQDTTHTPIVEQQAPATSNMVGQAASVQEASASATSADNPTGTDQVSAPRLPPFRSRARASNRIPTEILEDPALNAAIEENLPRTHDFEIHKTVWRLRRANVRHVGLQMPEGLQGWATSVSDILRAFVPTLESATVFGDVTFGACCIDDLGAAALGVDMLVHYGHSCIVPTDQTTVTTLYIHVEVEIDVEHLVDTVLHNFGAEKRIAFMGSVQFTSGMMQAVEELRQLSASDADDASKGRGSSKIPQVKPLHMGETLGCTSPHAGDVDAIIFVCDGRFHLESAMIQNPHVKGFYQYDPASMTLTREGFAHDQLHDSRKAAIEAAKGARLVGLILGTLGRQGSVGVLEEVERLLQKQGIPHLTILLSEISPERLALMPAVDAWVQVACPRLSMDWGSCYQKPLLTTYEAHVAFGSQKYKDVYPMDYYSNKGGPWANYGSHGGHGGSVGQKFRHLSTKSRRHVDVEYAEEREAV
eukprot:TRINITY_DN39373_c0_g1_i1.p1 TRINITY_DN39373_c0_g1~~TRINITY_DN39373_c0_g1_i1.p1  ORF type:complete len:497 (-),score=94.02 TRINITY_DN39373_c0_g1_i1:495-1985(-)